MEVIANAFTATAVLASLYFFAAGTVGLIRLPDTLSRIHPLSKADNIGLGLVAIGLLPQAGSIAEGAKIVVVWLLVQLSSGTVAQLMAHVALTEKSADEERSRTLDHGKP
jgi:multicomponent Na+:H+ antiporter subunit G